jgi:hypothetical protein
MAPDSVNSGNAAASQPGCDKVNQLRKNQCSNACCKEPSVRASHHHRHRPTRPIIDTDPGADDVVALLLAMASPDELNIRAITTVAGNVRLDKTSRNARLAREWGVA